MRRFVFIGFLLLASVATAFAQSAFSVLDTVHLNEVVSYGKLQKYQSGAKIRTISQREFSLSQDGSLKQLLTRSMPIRFKSHAGGLATIRIRGTAPDHTSINFGGININSLTLGHSNVSNVPLYLFDNLAVQLGSSSSVNGSGSIGGAIHLGLQNNWTKGVKAEFRVANGSFGEQLYGTKIFLGNGKFEAVTRAYFYAKKNNFKFLNSNYQDFEKQIFEIEDVQRNANIENKGLLQEFNYKFTENEFFTSSIWLEKDWHLIQQNMGDNIRNSDKRETYENEHLRLWAAYKNRKNPLKFELSGGYVYDNAVYNGSKKDPISTQRILGEAFMEHNVSSEISYKLGAKSTRIYPKVYAYAKSLSPENRFDFYASYFHRFFNRLTTTVNLRQGFVTNYNVPFTPSVGFSLVLLSKPKYLLNLTGNVARSYRIPTFNDRFWLPGGNPNIKPEKGMNYELGTKWSYCAPKTSGNIELNAFFMDIEDWVLWKSGGSYWYADNVQQVESKGVEFLADWNYQLFGLATTSGLSYTYASTVRKESLNETKAIGRQMEYVPLHAANVYSSTTFQRFNFTADASYTDKQFTNGEDKNILDAYLLLNVSAGYKLSIGRKNEIRINGMVNNLLNVDYQSSWQYAMPRRSYRLSLTYKIK